MRLLGVLHTGFTVSDIERSIAFYRDLLGMQLVHRQEGTAEYLATVTGFPGVRLKMAFLRTAPDEPHVLELLEYVSHPTEPIGGWLCSDLRGWFGNLPAVAVRVRQGDSLIPARRERGP